MALELGMACAGAALVATAWAADTAWFDRHFLPSFFHTRHQQLAITEALRIAAALIGLTLILIGRPWLKRYALQRQTRQGLVGIALIAGAVAAAIVTTELILRTQTWHAAHFHNSKEPLRIADPRLGWVFVPSHRGRERVSGRWIDYATDRHGYRTADTATGIDTALPTIVFSGESVLVGDGLQWQDSIAGQVGRQLGIPTANIAVNGYSSDQSYMRLRAELPRFSCPVAVVTLFMTGFLDRNLNDDRPHLDRNLRWRPANQNWRLTALARRIIPYRGQRAIDDGIAMTTAVLRATAALAGSRRAVPLLIVPAFTPETTAERALRSRVLDEAHLDYLLVPLDARLRLTGDMHPDARGAGAIANAITKRLEKYQIGNQSNSDKGGRNQCGAPMK